MAAAVLEIYLTPYVQKGRSADRSPLCMVRLETPYARQTLPERSRIAVMPAPALTGRSALFIVGLARSSLFP
jgi:hypothetical protein